MLSAWTTFRYRDGYVHEPSDRPGRVELTIWADGHARVAYRARANATPIIYEAPLQPWVLTELFSHLQAGGFPALPRHVATDDEHMALISVATATGTFQAWIMPPHRQMEPIDRSIRLLEGVANALSGGSLVAYEPLAQPVLVGG